MYFDGPYGPFTNQPLSDPCINGAHISALSGYLAGLYERLFAWRNQRGMYTNDYTFIHRELIVHVMGNDHSYYYHKKL